ncbi:MAG: PAS domain S-box protein [Actinomycetota bacterium]
MVNCEDKIREELEQEILELRQKLEIAEGTLRAIQQGEKGGHIVCQADNQFGISSPNGNASDRKSEEGRTGVDALAAGEMQLSHQNENLNESVARSDRQSWPKHHPSEKQLQQVLTAAQIGTWDWDILNNRYNWSSQTEKLFGIPEGSFDGTYETWETYLHPSDRATLRETVERSLTEHQELHAQYRIILSDGRIRWLEVFGNTLCDSEGKAIQQRGIVREISDRVAAQTALQRAKDEMEEKFQAFMNNSPAIASMKDQQGRYVYVNLECEQTFKISLADWLGKTDFDIYPPAIAQHLRENDLAVQQANQSLEFLETTVTAEGHCSYWLSFKFPFYDQAARPLIGAMSINITERLQVEQALRRSEILFRSTFEQSMIGIGLLTLRGAFFRVNSKCCTLLSYSSKEVFNLSLKDIIHPDEWEADVAHIHQLLGGDIKNFSQEKHLIRKDGSMIWASLEISLVLKPSGEPDYLMMIINDLSDRVQTEQALKESEGRLQAILDKAPALIYLKDLENRYQLVNQKFLEVFNLTKNQIIDQKFQEFLSPEIDRVFQENERRTLTALQSQEFEEKILHPDGIFHTYLSIKFPLTNLAKISYGICSISTDITHRKQIENALRESEQRFRRIFEDAPFGMAIISLNYQIFRANPMLCQMVGYTEEELTSLSLGELTYPNDIQHKLQAELDLIPENAPYKIEQQFINKNQQIFWVMLTLSLIREPAETPCYYLAMLEDITKRKQAEAELKKSENLYRQFFQANQAIKLVIESQTGVIFDANPAACRFYGYERSRLKQMRISDISSLPLERLFSQIEQVISTGQGYFQVPHKIASGEIRTVEIYGSKLIWQTQTLIYLVIHDITERKKTEQALQESEAILRSFYNNAPVMMGVVEVVDQDILHLSDNKASANFFGTNPKAMQNKFASELGFVPEVLQKWLRHYRECEDTGSPISFEYLHRTSLDRRWLSVTVCPITDAPGKHPRFSYIAEDVTEKKRSAQALMESERRFRAIFEQTFQLTAILKPDGTLIDANQSVLSFSGEFDLEVIGKPFWQMKWWPTSLKNQQQLQAAIRQAAAGKLVRYEVEALLNGEQAATLDFSLKPLKDELGGVELLIAEGRDITEIKQVQKALQQANVQLNNWVQELEIRNREIVLLGQLSDILQACLTKQEAHACIARLVQPLFPTLSGAVFALNSSKNLLEVVATWGDASATTQLVFAPKDCWGLRRGKLHLTGEKFFDIPCFHIHPPKDLKMEKKTEETGVQETPSSLNHYTSLCVPMMAQGEAMGILYLTSSQAEKLTKTQQQLAATAAEHIALALANIRLHEALQQQSIRDPLTGLFNRRYLEESLEREINRAERKQQPLSVIMIDIDHFKRFNDTYGHEAGDRVLRELGRFFSQQVRGSDIACRYGGEEFTLILPETSREVAQERAEQIRELVKALQLQYRNQDLGQITLSLGVAIFPEHGLTGEAVIRAADGALYRAKQEGRDRTVART